MNLYIVHQESHVYGVDTQERKTCTKSAYKKIYPYQMCIQVEATCTKQAGKCIPGIKYNTTVHRCMMKF